MNFGEKLKDLRTQKGWSQEELAKQMGVTRRTIGGQTRELFAGGSLSEEDQKAFAIEMQRIFMDSKKVAREKFTPKKYRKNAEDNGT